MTIIVFLIDNSASMNQRTVQGTTLLDVAKSATELFFKIRLSKSRVDRYFILTLDNECKYVKLAGWRQNVDLQCIHAALNTIKADGETPLSIGLQRTFRMLNLNRLQLGLENYGMGMFPSYIEPAVILCITDGCCSTSLDESILKDVSMSSIESAIFGQPLTCDSFRWDYRLYSIILRYPGFIETVSTSIPKNNINDLPLVKTSELTGGKSFLVSDNRELQQCLESLVPKCQPAVVVDFTSDVDFEQPETVHGKEGTHKQLVFIKLMGRVCSNWPIPETFWLDDELVSSQLPSRPAHPKIFVSKSQVQIPNMPEYFPVDRYELEPSLFTQMLCISDPAKVWQCFGADGKNAQSAPFGYLKSSPDLQTVHLHVLPYDYPNFCQLLNELYEVHHMRMSEAWGHRFVSYLSSIPRYYFMPLTKAFERFGFQSVIKPEAVDRVLPYQLKHTLQKLRHAAKIEYDNFVRSTQNGEHSSLGVKLPASLLPFPLWSLRELRPNMGRRAFQSGTHPYVRATDVDRYQLRVALKKMRHNLDDILSGRQNHSQGGSSHEQPVATMGDYLSYKATHEFDPILREINPSPERLDTFGNPFRKKTPSFIADEVYVDEMGLTTGLPGGANASLVVPGRKKQHAKLSGIVVRSKGPLPAYINHLNWREFSPKNSPPSSPVPNHTETIVNDTMSMATNQKQPPTAHTLLKSTEMSNKDAFISNERVVQDLTRIVREPHADGPGIFERLNDLSGSLAQRCAAISVVMSEALRFKRSALYSILKDWRQWILRSETCVPALSNSDSRQKSLECIASQEAEQDPLMTLIIESQRYQCEKSNVHAYVDRICSVSSVKSTASSFRERVHQFSSSSNLLYIHQGEMATVTCDTESIEIPSIVASDDATSCLIIVLRGSVSCTISHLDHPGRVRDFFDQVKATFTLEGNRAIDVHLAGGFVDDCHLSRKLLDIVMSELLCDDVLYALKTFCVADLNTALEPRSHGVRRPIIMGMAFNWKTNTATAATLSWSARGPLPALRLARLQTGDTRVVNVFDPVSRELVIMPFNCHYHIEDPKKLTRNDLAKLSTTPEQEPATFFEGLYASLDLLFRCPNILNYWFAEGALRFVCADDHSLPEGPINPSSMITWKPVNKAATFAIKDALGNVSQHM